ncbi:MAG: bifunctional tetrahydrofolate synthase/dihydrofolate synthase [Gammaproteobacteria bacterium]|nr:bifunctional tetrahydrofolate synthase/dihydrofolate synthase [Gammaproteobacteria bacterium]
MRFDTLADWLSWQETLHPNEIELGLERVADVLARLDLKAPSFTVVTVAGTNGKGSSVAMLEAILRAAGYRVGCYTSPHLLRYNERIRIDGETVNDRALCEAFDRVDRARGFGSQKKSLTYFEFGTLAAIDLLTRASVQIALLEVGLGGRLDAVNVLDPDVALITAIDVDHQDWLGCDRDTIAREKAGILRAGQRAVCADPRPPASLLAHAEQLDTQLLVAGRDFHWQARGDRWEWTGAQTHHLPQPTLAGRHQLDNAAGVLAVLQWLTTDFPVTPETIGQGLRSVQLLGRFQLMAGPPQHIFDVAHNPHSAGVLADNLAQQPCAGNTRAVLAMLADKDMAALADCLRGQVDHWYLAPLDVPRGATVTQLQAALGDADSSGFDSVSTALAAARQASRPEDRIVVLGSFYTVAAALAQAV